MSSKVTGPVRPTLKVLAAETGLAVATVSRALNDAPDIGAGTKARVREAARRIGYVPNRAGVRLRTGRSNVISILMTPERDLSGHVARLTHAFASTLRDTGYHLIVTPVFVDEDPLAPLRYLRDTRSADAVILHRTMPDDPRIAFLNDNEIAFATHGRTDMGIDHVWYDFDNTRFAEIATQAMIDRGRRSILVVAPPIDQYYAQCIMDGAERTANAAGCRLERLAAATSDDPSETLAAAVRDAVESGEFDGILCASLAATVTAVGAVERLGHVIGQSMDVAAKEPFAFLQTFRPAIIAVSENAEGAGAFLARATLKRLRDPGAPPMQHLESPETVTLPGD